MKRLSRRLSRHLLKIISVLLSVLLWLYVVSTEPLEVERFVDLHYELPEKKALVGQTVHEVKVLLKGPRILLRNLPSERWKIHLSIKQFRKIGRGRRRRFELTLERSHLQLPFGIQLMQVTPKKLGLKLERMVRKKLEVEVDTIGKLRDKLEFVRNEVLPKTVEVEGAKSELAEIQRIFTQSVDLGELEGVGERELKLVLPNRNLTVADGKTVRYRYSLRSNEANMDLENIPIRFLSTKQVVRSSHRYVTLSLLSETGDITPALKQQVQVIADIPEEKKRNYNVKPRVNLPQGLHLIAIHPESIQVRVK